MLPAKEATKKRMDVKSKQIRQMATIFEEHEFRPGDEWYVPTRKFRN